MNDTISSESPTPTPTPTPTKQIIAIPISVSTPTTTITFPPTPTSTLSPTLNPTATLMSTPIPKQKVYTGIGKSLHFKPGDTVVGWSIRIGTSFYKGGRVVLYDSPCEGIVTSGIINPDEWEITGETVITRDEILK